MWSIDVIARDVAEDLGGQIIVQFDAFRLNGVEAVILEGAPASLRLLTEANRPWRHREIASECR